MARTKWKDIEVSSLQEFNAETHRLTIESIQQAMNELLRTKPFREITVLDIVKKAGVSRSAFYRNYQSKEQVLESIVYDMFAKMVQELKTTSDLGDKRFWKHLMIGCIEQCQKFYYISKCDGWSGDTVLQCMNEYFEENFSSIFAGDKLQMRYWMGGSYNVIHGWIEDGMPCSPEELADRLFDVIDIDK